MKNILMRIKYKQDSIRNEFYKRREECGNGSFGDKKLGQITYYKVGNAGDTVLSQCVRKLFEKDKKLRWKLFSVSDPVTDDTIGEINKLKGLIIGGGGLFLPDTNENSISGWQWAIDKNLLNKINVPIFVYSVGYNYFEGQTPNELFINNLNFLVEKADFIGLRNGGSVKAVKSLVSSDLKDKIVYQPCTTTLARKLYDTSLLKKEITNKIGFNLAFDRSEKRFGNNKEKVLNEIAKSAKMIENKGYKIVLIYHMEPDKEIKNYMVSAGVHFEELNLTNKKPLDILTAYNSIDMVLGMRGHAQMIPFGMNCEIISLGTHDKMKWFLEDIDATDWYVNLKENENNLSTTIFNKFIEVHETNKEETHKRLLASQEKLWNITLNNNKVINGFLK